MTLFEFVDTLPERHGARDEYTRLKREVALLKGELGCPAPGSPCAGCLEFRAPQCYSAKCDRYTRWLDAMKAIDDEKNIANAKIFVRLQPINTISMEPGENDPTATPKPVG
jgi:hypothetical protein